MGVGEEVFYDPASFRQYFKNIGRAYREQATTLIEICRLYVEASPQTYTKNDSLQNIFQLADDALSAAGSAKKGKTSEATDAFLRVQEEIDRFGSPSPREGAPDDYRKKLLDPKSAMKSAFEKDEESTRKLARVWSIFKFSIPRPSGSTKNVTFVNRKLLHEDHEGQSIMYQEIDDSTTTAEIIWKLNRYPDESGQRITLGQNPRFYLQLSRIRIIYDRSFHEDPLIDFAQGLVQSGDTIYVLSDKSCRFFLDAVKPRIFGNLWKPYKTIILKDIVGVLDSEDIVLRDIGKSQDYWHRPSKRSSITDSSQPRVQLGLGSDDEIVNELVGNLDGRALVDAALRSQNVDLMIRDRSKPEPPADSDWRPLPSLEASIRVKEPKDQTTPRQSATHLPHWQLGYLNPNVSDPSSIGGSTLFASSTASVDTAINVPDASLTMRAAGKGTQPAPPVRKEKKKRGNIFEKFRLQYHDP